MVSKGCSNRCVFCLEDDEMRGAADFGDPRLVMYLFERRDAVLFTCGEPTLSPALERMIATARELGYREIELVTNGRRLGRADYASRLVAAGLTGVTVSIHGPTATVHDALTGTKSWAQTHAGLRNLITLRDAQRLEVRSSSVITRPSLRVFDELLELLYTLGPDVINLNFVEPTGRAASAFDELVPRMSDVAARLEALPAPAAPVRELVVTGMPPCTLPPGFVRFGQREVIYLWDGRDFQRLQPNRGQIFREDCDRCRYRKQCDGVWKGYARTYGWDEFLPVEPNPA